MVIKKFVVTIIIVVMGILLFYSFFIKDSDNNSNVINENKVTVFKSITCGCCEIYVDYLKNKNFDVEVVNTYDNSIKIQYAIPTEMESCHTTILDSYFVEGHMPIEAIEKLLQEKPNIKGIAMPGMPSGSPGMPGVKTGDFVIYAVNHDGSYEEFMRL